MSVYINLTAGAGGTFNALLDACKLVNQFQCPAILHYEEFNVQVEVTPNVNPHVLYSKISPKLNGGIE